MLPSCTINVIKPMTIFYTSTKTEYGLAVFVRWQETCSIADFDFESWARTVSEAYFKHYPVVVGGKDKAHNQWVVSWPIDFPHEPFDGPWGFEYSTKSVKEFPTKATNG